MKVYIIDDYGLVILAGVQKEARTVYKTIAQIKARVQVCQWCNYSSKWTIMYFMKKHDRGAKILQW